MTKLIVGGFLFCAIFHGVSFGIKKGEFMQNPVNTPQKIGEPLNIFVKLLSLKDTRKAYKTVFLILGCSRVRTSYHPPFSDFA